jgi:hypothetical protein
MATNPAHASVVFNVDDGTLSGGIETLQSRELYEMHNYYEYLGDLTMPTSFVPISLEEARAWRQLYSGHEDLQTEAQRKTYQNFYDRLAAAIDTLTSSSAGGGVFVRLSTRSPKDAPPLLPRDQLIAALCAELTQLAHKHPTRYLPNAGDLHSLALHRTCFSLMKVTSASQALGLCALSNRCISDLKRALDNVENIPWHMTMIVREFVPMPFEFELRGFVYQRHLVALSQYATDVYVEPLVTHRETIATNVREFFTTRIQPRLARIPNLDSYILDLVLMCPDRDLTAIKVLELNPYHVHTGSCLFDWTADSDQLHGKGEFSFRVRMQRVEGTQTLRDADIVNAALQNMGLVRRPSELMPVIFTRAAKGCAIA